MLIATPVVRFSVEKVGGHASRAYIMTMGPPQVIGLDVERTEETHISWVYLTPTEAWKLKKPVNLGFLDYTNPELRKQACENEVRLNRRLAPDVYLGVVSLGRNAAGQLVPGGDPPVDWAVRMRRLSDDDRANARLARGALSVDHIDLVAARVADFHASCPVAPPEFARPELIAHNIVENFAQADDCPAQLLGLEAALEVEAWQLGWMHRNVDLLEARGRDGYVRDGHGDLRLDHVYLGDDGVRIIDCIEFNERFRYADVAADVAFLSMDLARSQHPQLAERLLARYVRSTGDFDLYRLIDFYESYRAFVRGKIGCMSLTTGAASDLEEARRNTRTYFLMAQACGRPSLVPPRVVAVGGLIGAGKSTVADALSFALGCPTIEADRTRKELMGAKPTDNLASGTFINAYSREMTERVYDELMARAAPVLRSGRSVVLDASFRKACLRDKASALADRHGVPFRFVECVAPEAELRHRLRMRKREETASDATADLLDAFMASYEPPVPSHQVIRLNTVGSLQDVRARAEALAS